MTTSIRSEASRSVVEVNGVDRVAFNDNGSMELLTPAANPTGNSVPTAQQSVGHGQSLQNVESQRALGGGPYVNDTGQPIIVYVGVGHVSGVALVETFLNGLSLGKTRCSEYNGTSHQDSPQVITVFVPPEWAYQITQASGTAKVISWKEIRA